jgi:hypothetical protein
MSDLRDMGAVALATLAIGLAACGGDGDDTTTTREASKGEAPPNVVNVDRFLMQKDEEPGFRPGALPGAMPDSRETITGVEAFVQDLGLPPAEEKRLRSEGFVSFTVAPLRGPRTAGLSDLALYMTGEGAQRSLAHELRPGVIRRSGPVENLRFFPVPGIPGARGWTASVGGPHDVGNVYWSQGRCMLTLGNQGPGPLAGPLSKGARAIYPRTDGACP